VNKEERERKLYEQIERELAAEPTGYDVLVETKKKNIMELAELVHNNPGITRKEITKKLHISLRTASRYLSVIRKVIKTYKPVSDVQKQQMNERVSKLRILVKKSPSMAISEISEKLDVSTHTVYKYLKILEKERK